ARPARLCSRRRTIDVLASLLLREEAEEPVREHGEEHGGLLEGHEHPGELLVLERVEPPDSMVSMDVEVVDRVWHESHNEPDRAREDEGGEDVACPRPGAEPVRLVLE